MKYKIDIWDVDKEFNQVAVDPVVHYREPAQFQNLSKRLEHHVNLESLENPENPDIRLSEEMLTKCNVHAIYTKIDSVEYWADNVTLPTSKSETGFSLAGKPVTYHPMDPVNGSHAKSPSNPQTSLTKSFPKKSIVIELAGYLYKPEKTYENTKELMKWASASTGYGKGTLPAAPQPAASPPVAPQPVAEQKILTPTTTEQAPTEQAPTVDNTKYRKVLLRVINQKNNDLFMERTHRIVYLPKATVISYTESFDTAKGLGTFNLVIQQDPDEIDRVIIDAPKAGAGLFHGLAAISKGLEAAGKVVDMVSNTVAVAASGVAIVAKGAEMLTGKKLKGLDEVSKGMKDASGAMGGFGSLLGASADRSLSKTERANKAANSLKAIDKNVVNLDKETVKGRKEEWDKNEKEAKAQKEFKRRQNQKKAMEELDKEMQKTVNDTPWLRQVMSATDGAHQTVVTATKMQLKATREVADAKQALMKAQAMNNPVAEEQARQDLDKKQQALKVADAAVTAAQTTLDEAVKKEAAKFNSLTAKEKAAYTRVRDAQKKNNT